MVVEQVAVPRAFKFIHKHLMAITILSLLVLMPCFWHRRIEAGDLPSHTYNAWLAQLIEQGKAPGLYAVRQWTNVLFDLLLLYSTKIFGFVLGPKVAVSTCALLFFWGVFSFVAVASRRPPWLLTPIIAMVTYGTTFHMGFLNYYLSVGLACFSLAIFWNAQKWDWIAGALVFLLAVLAHPVGSLWCLATLVYISVRQQFCGRWGLAIPGAAVLLVGGARWYLTHFTNVEINWPNKPFYFFNGTDQFIVSALGRWIAVACLTIFGSWAVYEFIEWKQYLTYGKPLARLVELYLLSFCIICVLPQDLRFYGNPAWMGFLVTRLTLVMAILALCVAGCLRPRRSAAIAFFGCAMVYFVTLYHDTATINRLEMNAEEIISQFSYGTRVVPTLAIPDLRMRFIGHVIDRACIGHCFVYSNAEPSSRLFRIRVHEGSPLASASNADAQAMELGEYVLRAGDPPLIDIYQCGLGNILMLCARSLPVGDQTGPPRPGSKE